jgi:hypothetical protein
MSNIISINGYRLQYHNGEPMIEDLELAKRLGYELPYDIRKLIRRMLDSGQLTQEQVFATVAKTSEKGGRPGVTYYLGEFAALKVTTKSDTENADEITNEIIQVFIDAKHGKPPVPRATDPVITKARQADALMTTYLKVSKLLGTDIPTARAIAVEHVRTTIGMDFRPLLIGNNVAEAPLTPTDLGKELGLNARKMNVALEQDGFQEKDEHDEWRPTEKGRPYCTVNPYKSPNSDHVGYRVLWYRRVLDALTKAA